MSGNDARENSLYGPPLSESEGIGALTLGGFLLEVCARYPDNEALVLHETSGERVAWTYRELQNQSWQIGRAMIAAGVGKGTRVGLLMGSRPECVATIFGTALAGGIIVPLSTMATAEELEYMVRHADIGLLVTQASLADKHRLLDTVLQFCPEARDANGKLRSANFPYLKQIIALGGETAGAVQSWSAFCEMGKAVDDELVQACNSQVSPADLGLVIYSSGTTSLPKGMMHNHRAPTLQAWHQAAIFCRTPQTRLWSTFPLFWTAGFNTVMGATLAAGACWVMQELFEAGAALKLIAAERVTEPYALPHHTGAMEEHPDWATTDFSSVRNVNPRSPFARHPTVNRDTGRNGVWAYGSSETCAISITHYANTPVEISSQSTGRVLPGNCLRIIDPDSGDILGPGQSGEMCIKGPTLMDRYVKKNKEECFDDDGFFHSGDGGHYDEEGFVHWTGRMDDMIKTAGANVSPAELERVIQSRFPTLKIGRVVGAPDARLGQIVVLCVVPQEGSTVTEDEIKAGLRERVAAYKVPRHVLFFSDDEIPMTASAEKVKDAELRDIVKQRLGAQTH